MYTCSKVQIMNSQVLGVNKNIDTCPPKHNQLGARSVALLKSHVRLTIVSLSLLLKKLSFHNGFGKMIGS